jgi:hypothetical protein
MRPVRIFIHCSQAAVPDFKLESLLSTRTLSTSLCLPYYHRVLLIAIRAAFIRYRSILPFALANALQYSTVTDTITVLLLLAPNNLLLSLSLFLARYSLLSLSLFDAISV